MMARIMRIPLSAAILASTLVHTDGFAPITSRGHFASITTHHDKLPSFSAQLGIHPYQLRIANRDTKLCMSDNDND